MIIDCHGHYTTVPRKLHTWRDHQLAAVTVGSERPQPAELDVSDEEMRQSITEGQLKLQKQRGTPTSRYLVSVSNQGCGQLNWPYTRYALPPGFGRSPVAAPPIG